MKSWNIFSLSLILIALACSCGDKTGSIEGILLNGSVEDELQQEPLKNARIVLCRIKGDILPEGPVVSEANDKNAEEIGVLLAEPIVLTDSKGEFVLSEVPCGTYLVLFHLFPGELEHVQWQDKVLTETIIDMETGQIPPSGKPDFWEDGGLAFVNADWSSQDGLTAVDGNVCSGKLGFCFLLRDKKAYPVVEVLADSIVSVRLMTPIKPK
jgi:hypothetical protein